MDSSSSLFFFDMLNFYTRYLYCLRELCCQHTLADTRSHPDSPEDKVYPSSKSNVTTLMAAKAFLNPRGSVVNEAAHIREQIPVMKACTPNPKHTHTRTHTLSDAEGRELSDTVSQIIPLMHILLPPSHKQRSLTQSGDWHGIGLSLVKVN